VKNIKWKLEHKLMLFIIPVIIFTILILGFFESIAMESLYRNSVSNQMRFMMDYYIDEHPRQYYSLLIKNGLQKVESFVMQYKKQAIEKAADFASEYDITFIIYDRNTNILHRQDGAGNTAVSADIFKKDIIPRIVKADNTEAVFDKTTKTYYISRNFKPWNWTVIAGVPNISLITQIKKQSARNIILGVVLSIIMPLIFMYGLRKIVVNPIKIIEDAAYKISDNQDIVQISYKAKDEIGSLSRSIEAMYAHIKEQRKQLEQNQENLEHVVTEQTSELIKTNRELEEEIDSRDIIEKNLQHALEENKVLLREIHHRVKNNLNVVASLLSLQSQEIKTVEDAKSAFQKSHDRIHSMALVHGELYKSSDYSHIDMKPYISRLLENLEYQYGKTDTIDLELKIEDIRLNINQAVPCGIIINELATNALKHAFPNGRKGRIEVGLLQQNESYQMYVKDDGVGLPGSFHIGNTDTLGYQLVVLLVKQIGGTLSVSKETGTSFVVDF